MWHIEHHLCSITCKEKLKTISIKPVIFRLNSPHFVRNQIVQTVDSMTACIRETPPES